MDSVWDTHPNEEAIALLAPYKAKLDSMMNHVIGISAQAMDADRPESLLQATAAAIEDPPPGSGSSSSGPKFQP
jgi:hypothetical protein